MRCSSAGIALGLASCLFFTTGAAAHAGAAHAALGVNLPTLGSAFPDRGLRWPQVRAQFFSPQVAADIRDGLHATYVRTGWIPGWVRKEPPRPWFREDQALDALCTSGLRVMIVVPGPGQDPAGVGDLIASAKEFFTRYRRREPGCIAWAEIANEPDLPANGFASVDAYARYYARIAPVVASFGLPVIAGGTSGEKVAWTSRLSALLGAESPPPPLAGVGFHPYGVSVARLPRSLAAVRAAAGGATAFVTELGEERASDLYDAILALAPLAPAITVYEYRAQPGEDPRYALTSDPRRYDAFARAALAL